MKTSGSGVLSEGVGLPLDCRHSIGHRRQLTVTQIQRNFDSMQVSGNTLELFPAFPVSPKGADGIGGAVVAGFVRQAMVSGNVMTAGEVGAWWHDGSASSVLLKNDFASASYQALRYDGTNGPQHRFLILRNEFNQGYRYHLRPTWEDGRTYFFGENVFKSGTNIVGPFITPFGAPVHFRH